jgi:hypothetical protein
MRQIGKLSILLISLIVFLFYSCITEKPIHGVQITSKELETIDVLGFVETEFDATRYYDEKALIQEGYNKLLLIAKNQYPGDIDVKNIVLEKRGSTKNLLYLFALIGTSHYITVHAKGAVIK